MKKLLLAFSFVSCLVFGQYGEAVDYANTNAGYAQDQQHFDGNSGAGWGGAGVGVGYEGGSSVSGGDGHVPQNWERDLGCGKHLVCTYCPQNYKTCKCIKVPQVSYQKCCRYVPQCYTQRCCRYVTVPQYYDQQCTRQVPQYYTTCNTTYCDKYVYEDHCRYVPQYSYRQDPQCCEPAPQACCPAPAPQACCQ